MGRLSRVWIALLCLAGTVACTKVQAKVPPPAPPPPALITATPPDPLVVPAPLVERVPLQISDPAPSSAKPTPPASRGGDRVTPPVTPPPAAAPPEPPPPQALQTTANVGEIERKAIESLDHATRDLERVDRNTLGQDARDQYDNAKRMMSVARAALANKNYRLAHEMAGKAAAMASLLVKG
jgi:hypothetical protein